MMIGRTLNKLTVVSLAYVDDKYHKHWVCQCECGGTAVVRQDNLRSGATQSCGCSAREHTTRLHNLSRSERRRYTRSSYTSMVQRALNPNSPSYSRYGGRGITVCDRWRVGEEGKTGWECFFQDMGPRPGGTSLDRVDNSRGYSPDNCRWANATQQRRNTSTCTLTETDVRYIRESIEPNAALAERFGVTAGHIWQVRRRRVWKDL